MFIEASDQSNLPRRQNDRAGLVTTNTLQPGAYCFNFWYHMWGGNIGALRIYTGNAVNSRQIIWQQPGELQLKLM